MKKLLVLAIALAGGSTYLGSTGGQGINNLSINPETQVPFTNMTMGSLPGAQILGILMTAWQGLSQTSGQQTVLGPQPAASVLPAGFAPPGLAPAPAQTPLAARVSAPAQQARGADLGNLPPELPRQFTPALLNGDQAALQNLNPVQQQMIQQLIGQARANPTAFMDQLKVVNKALGAK